jgi:L-aspartate oxidase
MGGVTVDGRGRSTVPGLWAVGEVASTGLHGANRLASNSLLEAAVCSRWVADDLADHGGRHGRRRTGSEVPSHELRVTVPSRGADDIRSLMSSSVGVVRDGPTLSRVVDRLTTAVDRTGLDATDDATLVALLIATSALRREESRGAHSRTDFPEAAAPRHITLTLQDVAGDVLPTAARSAS